MTIRENGNKLNYISALYILHIIIKKTVVEKYMKKEYKQYIFYHL